MNTITITSEKKDFIKQIHFNLWDSKKNKLKFLDIGILCKNDTYVIKIQLPDSSNSLKFKDLSEKLIKNIPNAIFNESVEVVEKNNIKIFKIENATIKKDFILSPVDFSICNKGNGKIAIPVEKEDFSGEKSGIENKYYRFRILFPDFSSVIVERASQGNSFESSFSSCKIIDFRLNDSKLLSASDTKKLVKNSYCFEKIHFLYISDIDEDIQLASDKYSSRFLERGVWDDYLDLKKKKSEMIAYHLKAENSFSPSFLFKCQYNKTSLLHLLVYAGIVVILAVLANCFTRLVLHL